MIGNTEDERLFNAIKSASDIIDTVTQRCFQPVLATRYFDGNEPLDVDDLLSVTTFKTDEDNDLDYDNTLTENTDFILWPYNRFPKRRIKLSPTSSYASFGGANDKGIQITGLWAYALSATPYSASGTTVASIDASTTTLTPADITKIDIGQTLKVEDEDMFVVDKGALSVTVERGANGTTAASHTSKTIYIYGYPNDIVRVCLSIAGRLFTQEGKTQASERLGDYSYNLEKDLLEWEKQILIRYQENAVD